jgi:vancomycin resistance protein YoaR
MPLGGVRGDAMSRWLGSAVACLAVAAVSLLGYSVVPRETRIGSYATSLLGRSFSQRHNALMAARRIDGAVIGPGQEFSFNRRVGSYSSDEGYRRAPVSYNGQLIDEWGGGVCQTSTTLYNAALLAGMQIVERNPHHFCPSYVPPGRDAAVAYPSIDLRFRNPYPYPVRLHALVDRNEVAVDVFSPRPLPQKMEVVERVLDKVDPERITYGHRGRAARVRASGRSGYAVVVYRYEGDRRELISEDEYPVMNRVVEYRP